jgi:hypothetical protein
MHMMLQEDRCPVSEEVLGLLYSADPVRLAELIATIPLSSRAQLAWYCSRRAHLAAIGRAVASHCGEWELERAAGKAGVRLFEEAQGMHDFASFSPRTRRPVSLSTSMLQNVVVQVDDEAAEDADQGSLDPAGELALCA